MSYLPGCNRLRLPGGFFRTANDLALAVGFVRRRLDMKVALGSVHGAIEQGIADIAPTEYSAGEQKGFHCHCCLPDLIPRPPTLRSGPHYLLEL